MCVQCKRNKASLKLIIQNLIRIHSEFESRPISSREKLITVIGCLVVLEDK